MKTLPTSTEMLQTAYAEVWGTQPPADVEAAAERQYVRPIRDPEPYQMIAFTTAPTSWSGRVVLDGSTSTIPVRWGGSSW